MATQIEVTDGQLSDDGRSFWWQGSWQPSSSPDGLNKWEGQGWQPIPPGPPAYPRTTEAPSDIDDRGFASGGDPPKISELPEGAIYQSGAVAVGSGWMAARVLGSDWERIQVRDIQSIAIVPPSRGRQIAFLRLPTLPKPLIAIKDRLGRVIAVNVVKFSREASQALVSQLPGDTNVTSAASQFLSTGSLPGQWGKRFVAWKSID